MWNLARSTVPVRGLKYIYFNPFYMTSAIIEFNSTELLFSSLLKVVCVHVECSKTHVLKES